MASVNICFGRFELSYASIIDFLLEYSIRADIFQLYAVSHQTHKHIHQTIHEKCTIKAFPIPLAIKCKHIALYNDFVLQSL